MELSEYFELMSGRGILATADSSGKVNTAIYARPHFIDQNTVAFIMAERLTYENLKSNPQAAYLYITWKWERGTRGSDCILRNYEKSRIANSLWKYAGSVITPSTT